MIVYALCDPHTGEVRYVGQTTKTIEYRLRVHLKEARNGARRHVYDWIRKVGEPSYFILEECTSLSELDEAERFWIAWYRGIGSHLCNHRCGGQTNTAGRRFRGTKDVRGSRNPFFGRKHSDATRRKISETLKRRAAEKQLFTEEHRAHLSEAARRQWSEGRGKGGWGARPKS